MLRSHGACVRRGRPGVWLSAVAALVAVLVSSVFVTTAGSASRAAGLIAFMRNDGVYVMREDGTGVRALRRGPVASGASNLDWSPDGRRLAFESGGGLWVMDADGRNLAHLVAPLDVDGWEGGAHSPTWSPNGRMIAFSIGIRCCSKPRSEKVKGIWVVNADGSNLRRFMRLSGLGSDTGVAEIDWSPDGPFALSGHGGYLGWVYVVDADGTHLRRLSVRGWAWDDSPAWSPDGRRIAYHGSPGTIISPSTSEIYLVDPAGRSHTRLTSNRVADEHPTWSPDGQQIAYVHGGPYRRKPSEIFVVNADGTSATRLTTGSNPAWQPSTAP